MNFNKKVLSIQSLVRDAAQIEFEHVSFWNETQLNYFSGWIQSFINSADTSYTFNIWVFAIGY